MDRLRTWTTEPLRAGVIWTGDMPEELNTLMKAAQARRSSPDRGPVRDLYMTAKEIVFDVNEEGTVTLTSVNWLVDAETFELVLVPTIEGRFDDDDGIKLQMLSAIANEVPIVANNEIVAPRLEALYADLMANGFSATVDQRKQRYQVADRLRLDASADRTSHRLLQPAEVGHLWTRLREERQQNVQAKTVLARLNAAISELRSHLAQTKRNESALQACLTRYPVLLGTSYRRVIPKHKLGERYVTDYALELFDGSVDVMEIEASTHYLYNRRGDPTAQLVHAEQQILDWLAWLDEHSAYARVNLPGVRRPRGIVVMGCRDHLREGDAERLRWRNSAYAGRLAILTFDDLVEQCEGLQLLLTNHDA